MKNISRYFSYIKKNFRKYNVYFFCNLDKETNCIQSNNSWSYELKDPHIKGSFKDRRGNYAIFYTCKVCEKK